MKENKISKKILKLLGLFLILFLSLASPTGTKALSICFPLVGCSSPDSSAFYKEAEDRYGFDQDIWRSAKRKEYAPRVEIFFDNTNPKIGEKVTAHAVPEFFKNDVHNIYYTWYIIHTKDGTPQKATNTIKEGIIEASKIMSRGDYDPDLDGQNYSDPSQDPDKDGWPATDNDEEKDFAPFGGADGVGGLDKAHTQSACSKRGERNYALCAYNTTDPTSLDYYTLQSSQSNYWCDACYDYFSTSGGLPSNSSTEQRNYCCYTVDPPTFVDPDTGLDTDYPYDSAVDYCSGKTYADPYKTCFDNFGTANQDTVSDCIDSQYSQCVARYTSVNEEIYEDVSRCYRHKFSAGSEMTSFRTDDQSGLDFPVGCDHKWEDAPGYESGSGHFETGEEKYWKTDPTDPDTDGDGFFDEADVIGLGQETFTWTYRAGDRIGIVAEGTSMIPTDEKNAYYKIMWGYPDVCNSTKKDLLDDDECDHSEDYGFGFLATKAPGEQEGEKLKVSLSFSPDNPVADPSDENKENISSDGVIADADVITVNSSLDNTTLDPKNLYYTWQISKSTDLASDDWDEVENAKSNFHLASATSGLGLTSLAFSPKEKVLEEDTASLIYFKVTLTLTTSSDVKQDRGRTSVIIPVNKNGIKISLHKVEVEDGKAVIGEEVCNKDLYKILCPAVQGQMLAAKISGKKYNTTNSKFSWNLDSDVHNPPANSSDLFSGWSDTAIFFPITKESGELENVSVTAAPTDKLQPVTASRMITIVEPTVFIRSSDENSSWPVTYSAPDENNPRAFKKYSAHDAFEAPPSTEISYRLDFVPDYLFEKDPDNTVIDWSIDGMDAYASENISLGDDQRSIQLLTSENIGTYQNIRAEAKKYWSQKEREISAAAWGVFPEAISSESSISAVVVDSSVNEELTLANPQQILAAVGTHLPYYVMYNLRLALTILVMFFASAGFYVLSQKVRLYENK